MHETELLANKTPILDFPKNCPDIYVWLLSKQF